MYKPNQILLKSKVHNDKYISNGVQVNVRAEKDGQKEMNNMSEKFTVKGSDEKITRNELQVRSALGLLVPSYNDIAQYESSSWVKCNNKNCCYQDVVPDSWRGKVLGKEVKCYSCNRSYFNINNEKTFERRSVWSDIRHTVQNPIVDEVVQ